MGLYALYGKILFKFLRLVSKQISIFTQTILWNLL